MAISPAGRFNYTVRLERTAAGALLGRAEPSEPRFHPGMAGNRPAIELARGIVTLRNRESAATKLLNRHYGRFSMPRAEVSIHVGTVIESIVEEGDVLCIGRAGTGDRWLRIHRDGALLAAIGAVAGTLLQEHATVEEDPRAHETHLYSIVSMLAEPDTALVWLHASDPDLTDRIAALHQIGDKERILVAIAGSSADERCALNRRVSESRRHGEPSHRYYDVDERFATVHEWLAYLRTLPRSRPTDLWIRIGIDGSSTRLQEGEYAFSSPWHLFVHRVYKQGIPGELSQLAIVREHPALSRADVIETTRLLADESARVFHWR